MDLVYGQARMVTKVKRPTGELQIGSGEPLMDDIAEYTTWIEKNTELVLKAANIQDIVEVGDKITITIDIAKEAPKHGSNGNWSS